MGASARSRRIPEMSQRAKNFCRFDREMDEKLIELVSKNEVLYNTGHKLYKDMTVRDDVWLAISTVVGKNVNDCKTRWRSLRDLYHRKRKDVKKGKRSRSQWEYMDMLAFLDSFTMEKKSEIKTEETCDAKEDSNETKSNDQFPSNNYMNIIALPFGMNEQQSFKVPTVDEPKLENKRLKSDHAEASTKTDNDVVHLLRDIRNATQAKQHPIKLFFDSMASTVMDFPPALAAEAKLKVCQIIAELECRMLNETGCIDSEQDGNF